MSSSSLKLLEQFSNWLLPLPTPEWASKSINFCHRRVVSDVFIEHWCVVVSEGDFLAHSTLQEANQHLLLQNLGSSVEAACLFLAVFRVCGGQVRGVYAGQWNTAGQGVTAPAATGQTNWIWEDEEQRGTSLLYKHSQHCGNVSPVHCKTFINCYTGCLLPFLKFTCLHLQEMKIITFLIIWDTSVQTLGSKNCAFCLY